MGIFGFGSMTGALIGGQLADQIGRRFVMMLALFGGAIMLFVLGAVREPWQIMLCVFVFSTLVDMYRPAASAMIADLVPPEQRAEAFGLMYSLLNLGFAVAGVAGGFIAEYSFTWLFWGDGITTGLYGLVILLFISETSATSPQHDENQDSSTEESETSSEATQAAEVPFFEAMKRVASDHAYMIFLLAGFLGSIVFMQGETTLPLHMKSEGISSRTYGLLISVNGLMIVLFQVPIAHGLRGFNSMKVIILGTAVMGVGFVINAFATEFLLFGLSIVVWTIGEMIQSPFCSKVINDLAPPELRARYMAPFSMSFSAALMVGAPLGGRVLTAYGPQILWLSCGGLILIAVILQTTILTSVTARTNSEKEPESA